MENQNNNPQQPHNDDWLDEILGTQDVVEELGPDEQAIAAAGLTHPDDLELERIVQETMAEDFESKPLTENAPEQNTEETHERGTF